MILGRLGGPCPPSPPPTFLRSKKKKRKQRKKKRKIFKAETIKRLSPRSKCYCFYHSRVSRIHKFFFPVNHGGRQYLPLFHGPSTLKSILPVLVTLHQLRLKMRGNHFSCKLPHKFLNICELMVVVERNKDGPFLYLLSRELTVCVKENPDKGIASSFT